jgi:hypothetical protein
LGCKIWKEHKHHVTIHIYRSIVLILTWNYRHGHKNTVLQVKWNQNGNWFASASRYRIIVPFIILLNMWYKGSTGKIVRHKNHERASNIARSQEGSHRQIALQWISCMTYDTISDCTSSISWKFDSKRWLWWYYIVLDRRVIHSLS